MIGVFGYLVWRSAYNRIARQIRHLRSPRYVAALLCGVVYLWFMVIAQRPVGGSTIADSGWIELVGAIALLGTVAWGWIFGVERRVLRFTPAEVTFLFSAPVSRRGLIQFKLLHSQLFILFNALLWTLILSRERFGISPWLRVVSIWVLLTTRLVPSARCFVRANEPGPARPAGSSPPGGFAGGAGTRSGGTHLDHW